MKKFSLRLPDDLHQRIKDIADKNYRSIHAEILWAIQKHIEEQEKEDEK